MAGCGAWCGKVEADRPGFTNAMNHGLRRNYAAVTMDGGHWGAPAGIASWIHVKDPIARFDFDQRAVTETARVTKEVIAAYYGKAPEKSYSRAAPPAAARRTWKPGSTPRTSTASSAGAPLALRLAGTPAWAWNVKANIGPDGGPSWPREAADAPEAVYDACAGEDGLIEDPAQCRFEPDSLECQGADAANCLTAAEVRAREWYGGAKDQSGRADLSGRAAWLRALLVSLARP